MNPYITKNKLVIVAYAKLNNQSRADKAAVELAAQDMQPLLRMVQVFAFTLFFTITMLFLEIIIFKPLETFLFRWRLAVKS